MIKCEMGITEISGESNVVYAEAVCIMKNLREVVGEEDFNVILEVSTKPIGDLLDSLIEKLMKKLYGIGGNE